jgi:hypothetical protein
MEEIRLTVETYRSLSIQINPASSQTFDENHAVSSGERMTKMKNTCPNKNMLEEKKE